jgi:hypothetical protein
MYFAKVPVKRALEQLLEAQAVRAQAAAMEPQPVRTFWATRGRRSAPRATKPPHPGFSMVGPFR